MIRQLKLILSLSILLFISGCSIENINQITNDESHNFIDEDIKPDINTILNKKIKYYYREILDSNITCTLGNCPNKTFKTTLLKNNCFFCENFSEVFEDKLIVRTSGLNNADMFSGCSERDYFNLPSELNIIEKTDDIIIAIGVGSGNHEEIGENCQNEYKYNYQTKEKWIFSTKKLGNETKVILKISNNKSVITAPGWKNPSGFNPPLSETYIDIFCESEKNFRVTPGVEVIAINNISGDDLTGITAKIDLDVYSQEENKIRIRFASFWNANYTIKAVCKSFDSEIQKTYSREEIIVEVKGAESGEYPKRLYIKE